MRIPGSFPTALRSQPPSPEKFRSRCVSNRLRNRSSCPMCPASILIGRSSRRSRPFAGIARLPSMSRREALLALLAIGFASATPRALAQPVARMRRVGFITLRSGPNEYDAAFRDALRSLGYVEGRTIRIDYRWAAGNEKRADELVADLLAQNVEVIVAATAPAIRAAMRATKRIPIVMAATADPVSSGLVASLARPGGNVTGLSLVSPDTAAKRLQLLQELIPSATRIGVLLMNTGVAREFDALIGQLEPAAQRLGLRLSMAAVRSGGEIDAALATMQRDRTH